MCGAGGVGKREIPHSHEWVCPLSLCVNQLSLGLSVSPPFRDSLLVLVLVQGLCSKVREGRSLSALPISWAELFPIVSSPGAWPVHSSLLHLHPLWLLLALSRASEALPLFLG